MHTVHTRREFVSCASHLALAAVCMPLAVRERWARVALGTVVADEPFGRLEQVGDGIWALISTPLGGDYTTTSNGGIIAGRSGVLAIEGFNTPAGATWLANKSRELTGRWPTHVVLTHYHADHANGVAGYLGNAAHPVVRTTTTTRELVLTRNTPTNDARVSAMRDAEVIVPIDATRIDLGSRMVRLVPRAGHTASDVSIEVDDPSLVFCGDLVWNGMFPNYVDATPSALARSVKALRRPGATTYVPGHGGVAHEGDVVRYVSMLDEVEAAARSAGAKGISAAEAAATFTLPKSLGEWIPFNKVFHERAFAAWYRDLSA